MKQKNICMDCWARCIYSNYVSDFFFAFLTRISPFENQKVKLQVEQPSAKYI